MLLNNDENSGNLTKYIIEIVKKQEGRITLGTDMSQLQSDAKCEKIMLNLPQFHSVLYKIN